MVKSSETTPQPAKPGKPQGESWQNSERAAHIAKHLEKTLPEEKPSEDS